MDRNRNRFYQQDLARTIQKQSDEMLEYLTHALNVHLNRGQNYSLSRSFLMIWMEKCSFASMFNRTFSSIEHIQVTFPSMIDLSLDDAAVVSFRVRSDVFFNVPAILLLMDLGDH